MFLQIARRFWLVSYSLWTEQIVFSSGQSERDSCRVCLQWRGESGQVFCCLLSSARLTSNLVKIFFTNFGFEAELHGSATECPTVNKRLDPSPTLSSVISQQKPWPVLWHFFQRRTLRNKTVLVSLSHIHTAIESAPRQSLTTKLLQGYG